MKSNQFVILTVIILVIGTNTIKSQVYSNREVKPTADSNEYPYILPILGEGAIKKGYKLPYSAGVGVNYLWQESELIINNLRVGFNNGEQINLDEIIKFNNAISTTNSFNVRPDIWLFPFLNVYGIFAQTNASTAVDFTITVPSSTGNKEVLSMATKAEFLATTTGVGITPTIGIAGGWMALDMNMAWTDIEALDEPAFSFVFGPRVGKTFKFKKEDMNIAFWAGGFRVVLNSGTNGSLPMSELFDTENLDGKIDNAYVSLGESQTELDTWWGSLSALEQQHPKNQARYNTTQNIIDKSNDFVGKLDNASSNIEESTVQYGLDKRQKNMWNFIVGTQFQINRHFMIRAEYGFLGTRNQFIGGLQYRFGL